MTEKQKKFCKEYMIDLNATQASIRAGYSKKTADIIGFENLRKPNIIKYISKLKGRIEDKYEIRLNDVLKRIEKHAIDGESEQTQLKAEDMLMKHTGGYELDNKLEISTNVIDPFNDD